MEEWEHFSKDQKRFYAVTAEATMHQVQGILYSS